MKENNIQKLIMLAVSAAGTRVFRNNVGKAWIGNSELIKQDNVYRQLNTGDVIIRQARRFHAGLCEGSSDLIGWTPKKIKPEDVGKKIAVFTALEVKTKSGQVRDAQDVFLRSVEQAGGIASVCRSEQDALAAIHEALPSD